MPDEIFNTIEKFSSLGNIALWVAIGWLYKNRVKVIKALFNGNGNGSKESLSELHDQLATLQENHLHSLSEKLDRLTEREIAGNETAKEILFTLREMREDIKKHG